MELLLLVDEVLELLELVLDVEELEDVELVVVPAAGT